MEPSAELSDLNSWDAGGEARPMQIEEGAAVSRFKRLVPYFLIGPISGPLCAGIVINFRGGRPVLATLYVIALVQYALLLPLMAAKLGLDLL